MLGQQWNVLTAIPEWWQEDGDNVQAVVKVFPELTRFDTFLKV
jgi:hypothetical protein